MEDPQLAEGEFARHARLTLRQLGKPGARLYEKDGHWYVQSGTSHRRAGLRVEAAVVRELASRDWLIAEPSGGYRRSVAGERFLNGPEAPGGDRFADQHRLLRRPVKSQGGASSPEILINEAESPLGWLRSRRDKTGEPLISEAQFEAGEQLRVDFTVAQLSARITARWDMPLASSANGRSGPRPDSLLVNERAIAAKQRFMRALDAVGPELAGILVEVCCMARGLEAAERALGWPQRSGKLVLQLALTGLARHYGLIRPEPGPAARGSVRHWGASDFRPRVAIPDGETDQA